MTTDMEMAFAQALCIKIWGGLPPKLSERLVRVEPIGLDFYKYTYLVNDIVGYRLRYVQYKRKRKHQPQEERS